MKKLKFFAVALMFAGLTAQAQDSDNPWSISFGVNGIDTKVGYKGEEGLDFNQLNTHFDKWNILPSVSYLNVSRYIGSNFSVGLTGSVNKMDSWAVYSEGGDYYMNPGDLAYYGIDAEVKYSFMKMIGTKWFDPSLHLGGGYQFAGDASTGSINGGLGFNFWFTEQVGLQLKSTYHSSFNERNSAGDGYGAYEPDVDVPAFLQHMVGITFKFGGKDTDGDGIYDKDDACPETAGLKEFNGCPDTDGDGIADKDDACPEEAGTAEFNGCPDTDGDGIVDAQDACPTVKGTKMMNGCPDSDGDGIADKDDACPNEKGPKSNNGCPVVEKDTDGDGVVDKDDKCPTVKGTVANNGCPEVTEAVQKALNDYAKTILFDTGKSSIKAQSEKVLNDILGILKEYPNAKFTIDGYTDSVGREDSNLRLSDARALAVKDYLVSHGIDAFRLSSKGYGEANPIDTNATAAGRANNRRVEINLVK